MHHACHVEATTATHSSGSVPAVEQSSNRSIFESLSCQASRMKRSTVGQRCMLVTGSFSSEANHAGTSRLRVEAIVGLIGKALRYGIQVVSPTSWAGIFWVVPA